MSWKARIIRFLVIFLGASYALVGLMFIITFTPGGITLGLAFLGGSALLYGGAKLLRQLSEMAALLRILAFQRREEAAHEEMAVDANTAGRSAESARPWLRNA
jgi:hypothetical protein